MVMILDGGHHMASALLYGERHPSTTSYVRNMAAAASDILLDSARDWMGKIDSVYQAVDQSVIMQNLRAAQRKLGTLWRDDIIMPLWDIADFQHAQYTMRRWIMAEPETRTLFHKNAIEGFADNYVDTDPGRIGQQQYDYRRATNGLVMFNEEGGWTANTYFEDLRGDDRELTIQEMADIQTTWESLRRHLKRKKDDPTSPFNAQM